jgi:pectate lyase
VVTQLLQGPAAEQVSRRTTISMRNANWLGLYVATVLAAACGSEEPGSVGASGGHNTSGGMHVGGAAGRGTSGRGGSATNGGSATGGSGHAGAGDSPSDAGTTSGEAGASSGGTTSSGGSHSGAGASSGGTSGKAGAQSGGQGGHGGASSGRGGTGASGGDGTSGRAGAGTGASGGSAGTGSCDAPPEPSPLVGWAAVSGNDVATTTGGGDATPTVVTTLANFTDAVKGTDPAVIYVKGVLDAGKVSVGSNKTIAGVCGAEIHGHLELSGSVNVIVRNLKIVGYAVGDCSLDPDYDPSKGCSSGNDAVTVQKNAHHVWFDHCDISDGTDGNLDITNAADFVTVSWTKFHYTERTDDEGSDSTGSAGHRFSDLVGGTDSPSTYDDANALNVTWHHDYWADNVVERQPRVRFGRNHLFNNLWASSGDNYCVRAGTGARILVEHGVFDGVKDPHEFNSSTDETTANIAASDNDYSTATGKQDTGGGGPAIGTLPYSYTPDDVAGVAAAVKDGAGPK